MILTKLEKFFAFFWKEMLYLKFKVTLKPYFYLYLTFLFRQMDNDDTNIHENDIVIFPGQTNTGHRKYHKESNFYTIDSFSSTLSLNPINPGLFGLEITTLRGVFYPRCNSFLIEAMQLKFGTGILRDKVYLLRQEKSGSLWKNKILYL